MLSTKSKLIDFNNSTDVEVVSLLTRTMPEIMYQNSGVGLAAIQVGYPYQFLILDVGLGLDVYINPIITDFYDIKILQTEGCLSFPEGFRAQVKRHPHVRVQAQDIKGATFYVDTRLTSNTLYGLLQAHVLQHEIDHLNGLTFLDRLSNTGKSLAKKKLKKLGVEK